jgi:hypothetical protein
MKDLILDKPNISCSGNTLVINELYHFEQDEIENFLIFRKYEVTRQSDVIEPPIPKIS